MPVAPKPGHSAQCPLRPNFVTLRSAPCAQTPSLCAVPLAPKLRHSARSRGIHLRLPRHQPWNPAPFALHHGYCDFAQYDGCRHSRGSCGIQCPLRPNPVTLRSAPCAQTPSLCAVPLAPKLRHSARSRGIHLRLPRHQPWNPAPFAIHHGYCDFAQYDGCRHSRGSCGIQCPLRPNFVTLRSAPCAQTPSLCAVPPAPKPRHSAQCPLRPNFVIPRAVAESISACQGTSHGIQHPLRSTMDTATSRSMTAVVIPEGVAESSARCAQTRSFRAVPVAPKLRHSAQCPLRPNFVIPRAVAESISACQGTSHGIQHPLRSTMDTATSRSMTAVVIPEGVAESSARCAQTRSFRAVPVAPKPGHSVQCPLRPNFVTLRSAPCAQTSSFRAQSRNPSPLAKAPAMESSTLCDPPWILRLRAV